MSSGLVATRMAAWLGWVAILTRPAPVLSAASPASRTAPGMPSSTADHQDMPEIALVRAACPGFQGCCELHVVDAAVGRGYSVTIAFGYLEIGETNSTTVRRRVAEKQPGLQADEGHRHIRPDCDSQHLARVAMYSGWNIERQDRRRMRIDRRNCVCKLSADLAFEAAAEDAVDEQVGLIIEIAGPGHDHTAFGRKIAPGRRGIACQLVGIDEREHRHHDAIVRGKARHDVAVATVVAGTTDYLPALRVRESFPGFAHRGGRSTGHQRIAGDAMVLDGRPVRLTHGGN